MKKWIRWPGFIVFIAAVVLIAGGSYLFSGSIVKKLLEHSSTDLLVARVDLDRVNLYVMPLCFPFYTLQVTTPAHSIRL